MAASKSEVSHNGDGIGKEVVSEGVRGIGAAARLFGLNLLCERLDWRGDYEDDACFSRMIQPKVVARG